MDLEKFIRDVPNFPNEWIVFKDITPLLANSEAFTFAIDRLAEKLGDVDRIVWLDARGFIFASVIAYKLKKPLVIIRKKGKLPYKCISEPYCLEYWTDSLDLHVDAINEWEKIAIVDVLLATWWTVGASIKLIEELWGKVDSLNFVVMLGF